MGGLGLGSVCVCVCVWGGGLVFPVDCLISLTGEFTAPSPSSLMQVLDYYIHNWKCGLLIHIYPGPHLPGFRSSEQGANISIFCFHRRELLLITSTLLSTATTSPANRVWRLTACSSGVCNVDAWSRKC